MCLCVGEVAGFFWDVTECPKASSSLRFERSQCFGMDTGSMPEELNPCVYLAVCF